MTTTDDIKARFRADLDELSQIADEVRVKIHLAGLEAKDYWNELEPRLTELREKVVRDTGEPAVEATRKALDEVGDGLKKLRKRLGV